MKEHFNKIAKLHADLAHEFAALAAKHCDTSIADEIVSKVRSEFIKINVRHDSTFPGTINIPSTACVDINTPISPTPLPNHVVHVDRPANPDDLNHQPVEKEKPAAKKRETKEKAKTKAKEDNLTAGVAPDDNQIKEQQDLLKEALHHQEPSTELKSYTKLDLMNAITQFTDTYKASPKEERVIVFDILSKVLKKHKTTSVNDVQIENIAGIIHDLPQAKTDIATKIAEHKAKAAH